MTTEKCPRCAKPLPDGGGDFCSGACAADHYATIGRMLDGSDRAEIIRLRAQVAVLQRWADQQDGKP